MTVQTISSPDVTWNYSLLILWTYVTVGPCTEAARELEEHLRLIKHSIVEIDIGIICACSPALPAFFDRHCPRSLSYHASRFSSYCTSHFPFSKENKSIGAHCNNRLHDTSELSTHGRSGRSGLKTSEYNELADAVDLAALVTTSNRCADISMTTTVTASSSNKDIEAWEGESIRQTLSMYQS